MDKVNKAITSDESYFRYFPPEDVNAKVVLLTTGKTAHIGIWSDGYGVIAWAPLPKRNKKIEAQFEY